MVRLKGSESTIGKQVDTSFNSTMVRLKEGFHMDVVEQHFSFNSTMVRLKAYTKDANGIYSLFQFHNGSIKRKSKVSVKTYHNGFQFHNGSIKRTPILYLPCYRA